MDVNVPFITNFDKFYFLPFIKFKEKYKKIKTQGSLRIQLAFCWAPLWMGWKNLKMHNGDD